MQTYMPSRPGRDRALWFSQVCTGILGDTADHPAMLTEGFRTDLGDVHLLRGVIVARIGQLLLKGDPPSSVAEWVRSSEVFRAPPPTQKSTEALVRHVQGRIAGGGLWDGTNPWQLEVRLWDLEGLSEALLEYWATQRSAVVPLQRLRHELSGCWGVEDSRILDRTPGDLTNYERSLAAMPHGDRMFANECLNVYMFYLPRNSRLRLEETGPGTWGPFPWWSVVVEGPQQVESAQKVLARRNHPLTCHVPESKAAPLVLSLDAPMLASTRVVSEFWFYPRLARELCQLLIIAHRGSIAVEFCERSTEDEWEDDLTSLGVYLLDLSTEQARVIESWATGRLCELLPTPPVEPGEPMSLVLPQFLTTSKDIDPWDL
ncbi:hypothetical protein GCM10007079_30640 [Nocardiopsis terrae]|uniref:Uncharacterized protein n=1 Tax=Nocardiopsis terrae TaxID=372655 RepID=A0ABR9HIT6_9ACTN|nr:hypothetical protein [Nocardiopsis terrae]MBE1458891.1 hypothetical protein [Nocardiopsis terrae]GHC86943.1 hypothetical protein GCM10007079_30640 [Nocardiopsis terrae]